MLELTTLRKVARRIVKQLIPHFQEKHEAWTSSATVLIAKEELELRVTEIDDAFGKYHGWAHNYENQRYIPSKDFQTYLQQVHKQFLHEIQIPQNG